MGRGRDSSPLLVLLGLRFRARETEQEYRRWRVHATVPFARIGYIGSAPSWLLLLLAVVVLDSDSATEASIWVGSWILLLLVLTGLTFPVSLRRTVMPLAAVANCAAGFLVVWLLSDLVLRDEMRQLRAGVMVAGVIVVMFFGFAIFRIPPGIGMVAVTPYAAFASYQLYEAYEHDELTGVEASSLTAPLWIAYLGCLLVCVVVEIVDRRTFCKDQTIAAQQRELRTSREMIRRYVPRPVVERIVRGDMVGMDEPTRRRVTVLFADLVESTKLADRVEAEVSTQVANDFITAMSDLVDEHGGIVTEFAGDGLMALFGAPDEMAVEEQALSAVRAAQAMQARLPRLNQEWQRVGVTQPMLMRIGINTGVLSVGSFGSEGRMTYTAIGLQANIAARLQAHCDPGQVLLTDVTWHLVSDQVTCEARGEVDCKGVHYPVRVFSPVEGLPAPRTATEATGLGRAHTPGIGVATPRPGAE